jgi:hypothetical protein
VTHFLILLRPFSLVKVVAKFDKSGASQVIPQHNSGFKRVESQIGEFRLLDRPLLSPLAMFVHMQVIDTTLLENATGQHSG